VLAQAVGVADLEAGLLQQGDGLAEGRTYMSGAMTDSMKGPPPGHLPARDICWMSTRSPALRRHGRRVEDGRLLSDWDRRLGGT
jgi:hypothetical protein